MLDVITFNKAGQPSVKTETARVTNRTGATLVVGDLVQFDMIGNGETETQAGSGPNGGSNYTPFGESAAFANVVAPADQAVGTGAIFAIVTNLLDAGGVDNSDVEVTVQGIVTVAATGSSLARGAKLKPNGTSRNMILFAAAPGDTVIATTVEAVDVTSGGLIRALFYGKAGLLAGEDT